MIAALILAAGKGIRFGSGDLPKQFCEIDGRPIFIHSVQTYVGMTEIDRVIVAAHPQFVDRTRESLLRHELLARVDVAVGGETRQVSVQNAGALLGEENLGPGDTVILHNGISPNTSAQFIRDCLSALSGCDAVQACVPDTRTVCETDGQFVKRVLPRARLVYNCEPTIYRGDVFGHILRTQKQQGMTGEMTSDTALELGYRIRLVHSDYENIKVTNCRDLDALRAAMSLRKCS